MKRINNKGFTLVEVLAVVVILGILSAITIPTVSSLIAKNKLDNYENLKKSIISAAKIYMSDNRYNVSLENGSCDENNQRNIQKIDNLTLTNSHLMVKTLIDSGNIKETIKNPQTDQTLNTSTSYIIVKYDCQTKNYIYILEDSYLNWN